MRERSCRELCDAWFFLDSPNRSRAGSVVGDPVATQRRLPGRRPISVSHSAVNQKLFGRVSALADANIPHLSFASRLREGISRMKLCAVEDVFMIDLVDG